MSHYKIINTKLNESYECRERAGVVVDASRHIDWAINLPFGYLCIYAKRKGWQVVPVLDPEHPYEFTFKGKKYFLEWNGDKIERINVVEDGEETEINWSELPEQLKELL